MSRNLKALFNNAMSIISIVFKVNVYEYVDTIFVMKYNGNSMKIFLETSNFFYFLSSNNS